MTKKNAFLALEDGTLYKGFSEGEEGFFCGEVIFNSSMTGYQEVCTDPSYASQIVVFTRPHIGNTGTNEDDNESPHCWPTALVMRERPTKASHCHSTQEFSSFCTCPLLYGIDTRRLTNHLRDGGSKKGCLVIGECSTDEAVQLAKKYQPPHHTTLLSQVATNKPYPWSEGDVSITVYDFGVKRSILRTIASLGGRVTVVPPSYPLEQHQPDGIILSNGPGNPQEAQEAIMMVQKLLTTDVPVLGICFGCQLLGLAAGGTTVKMKQGHHGINHPVLDLEKQRAFITSQNHDFMIDETTLPEEVLITHRSLVDHSIQGIRWKDRPIFGFQGHPEGGPGPSDLTHLFDDFMHAAKEYSKKVSS